MKRFRPLLSSLILRFDQGGMRTLLRNQPHSGGALQVRSRPLPKFVVELPGSPSFAFEAADEAQAAAFADTPWFARALGEST
jgi:hypothetical protein